MNEKGASEEKSGDLELSQEAAEAVTGGSIEGARPAGTGPTNEASTGNPLITFNPPAPHKP